MIARQKLHVIYKDMLDSIVYRDFRSPTQPSIAVRMEAERLLDYFIDRWNPAAKNKPSTYFIGNIRDKLQRYVGEHANIVRITEQYQFKIGKYKRAVADLTQTLGRTPSSIEVHRYLAKKYGETEWSLKDVERLKRDLRTTTLATSAIGRQDEGNPLYMGDVAFAEGPDDPIEDYKFKVKMQDTLKKVNTLPEPQRTVLRHSFGLEGYPKLSLRDLSAKLGINKYRVQTYLEDAKNKLKE